MLVSFQVMRTSICCAELFALFLAPWHLVNCLGKRAIVWGKAGDAWLDWYVAYLACIHARGRDTWCDTAMVLPVNVRMTSALRTMVKNKDAISCSQMTGSKGFCKKSCKQPIPHCRTRPHQAPPSVAQRLGLTATIRSSKPLPSCQHIG